MSCILKDVASISGLTELICWLCPHLNNNDGLLNMSEGSTNAQEPEDDAPNELHHGWLDECIVSLSPMLDLMAIANRNRLAILTSRLERNKVGEKKSLFSVTWKGVVSHGLERDEITSLMCLSIISQKQSSAGAPDWTSVVVGFKSGFISFYTEAGLSLLTQIFEEKPVLSLVARTYVPKNFGACMYSDLSEELVILYPKCVISIDGFALLQTLKACRNQAAKVAASGGDCPSVATLGYKKWSLSEQEEVSGCAAAGMVPPHLYDHIMVMSNLRGFNQSMAGGTPTTTVLLTVGRVPYFASFSIKEGITQPFMADIAMHYASKIKNALVSAASGWLFRNKSSQDNSKTEKRKIEQPHAIPFRYTLPDKRRAGLSIHLSTSRRLAAVTDDFGRVSIIDVQKSCVVRMFKGYRDAECGWVTVWGDLGDTQREVPFLLIHAPRRNLLEVWLPQQGPRIAAFNVNKGSRLIYTPHTLLGAHTQQGRVFPTTPVVLINSDGTLERVSIPFHLALSGKTSRQARDAHLLKSFKLALRNKPVDQILCIVREIKTSAAKLQVINLIVNYKQLTVELARDVLAELGICESDDSMEDSEPRLVDHESRVLSQQLSRLSQLLRIYSFLSPLHSQESPPIVAEEEITRKLSSYLRLSEKELTQFLLYLKDEKVWVKSRKKVTFSERSMELGSFLLFWEMGLGGLEKNKWGAASIALKKLGEHDLSDLGRFFFGFRLTSCLLSEFCDCLKMGFNEDELIDLIFSYWLSQEELTDIRVICFFKQLLILTMFHLPRLASLKLSDISPLWDKTREKLKTSPKPLHAYVAAVVCKGVESSMLRNSDEIGLGKTPDDDFNPFQDVEKILQALEEPSVCASNLGSSEAWEEVSMDLVEWNFLLKKLKKLISVHKFYNILMQKAESSHQLEHTEYSIKALTLKGKGYLSELIAKWFIESKLPVENVIKAIKNLESENEKASENSDEIGSTEMTSVCEDVQMEDDEVVRIKEELRNVMAHFPESTKGDVLLINLCWEFAAAWRKDPNNMLLYGASIEALKSITNAFFKHGVSCMMWETWVVHCVQSTAQLMEKVSRRPKDRIIVREVGISEFHLEKFFTLTKDLLENIMSGNMACEMERPPIVAKDDFWKDVECSTCLAEVTVAQKLTSCDLTFLHFQLISVLRVIVRYDLRNVKPFSLFPERDRAAFFKPLISSWRLTSDEGKEVVSSSQLSFLSRVVSAAVISLSDTDVETPSGLQDALDIGREWGASLDAIRRHYVCELYSSGLDLMAEQALVLVRDGVMIASQIIVIAGQRLRYLITSSPKSIEVLALMTPNVKEWCMSLEPGSLRCPDVPVKRTLKMVNRALMLIPESSREHKIASNLSRSLDMICSGNLFDSDPR